MTADELLPLALLAAVPLRIEQLRLVPHDQLRALAREQATEWIGPRGDSILYRSRATSQAFEALVTALAALALVPSGGVRFAGIVWCAEHSPWGEEGGPWPCEGCA